MGGISLVGALGIVFLVLKLTHVIAWPWIWVLAPFWMGTAIGIVSIVIFFIVVFIVTVFRD